MVLRRELRGVLGLLVILAVAASGQGPVILPDPNASRPPLLTEQDPDSTRVQVRQLALSHLLNVLQQGDQVTIDAWLGPIAWAPEDRSAAVRPECSSLGRAARALAARQRSPLRVDIATVGLVDADSTQFVITLVTPGRGVRTRPAALIWGEADARWVAGRGLLAALCDAGAEMGR